MKTSHIRGFSLPEMMMVIMLVALLGTGMWHGWQQWQQQRQLEDSAQQVQRLLQRLRIDANWHNAARLLWLKPGSRWCLGTGHVPAVCAARSRNTLLAPWPQVEVASLTAGMGFYGKNNVARPGSIILVSEAGSRRIIVVSTRGRVRICPAAEGLCR